MKWNVQATASHLASYAWKVVNVKGSTIYQGDRDSCEKIAAAHNAVIDMAFDSPGNVS